MADIAVGQAIGAGFGLIRRRPGAVLVWGAAMAASVITSLVLFAPYYAAIFSAFLEARASGAAPRLADIPGLMPMRLLSNLFSLVQYFVATVVNCAIFRAILRPDERAWASLRLGATELLLFVIVVGLFMVFLIGVVILAVPAVIVVVVLGLAHAGASVFAVIFTLYLAILGVGVWLMLRLAMIGPMMVDDGKVHLTDAWALTRGRAGRLFQIGLGVFAILLAGELVVMMVFLAASLGAIGGVQALPDLLRAPNGAMLARLAPVLTIVSLAAVPLYGAVATIATAPWARAYLDLKAAPALGPIGGAAP